MKAAGVNPVDNYVASTGFFPNTPAIPFVAGFDGAGVVEAVGAQVTKFKAPSDSYLYSYLIVNFHTSALKTSSHWWKMCFFSKARRSRLFFRAVHRLVRREDSGWGVERRSSRRRGRLRSGGRARSALFECLQSFGSNVCLPYFASSYARLL